MAFELQNGSGNLFKNRRHQDGDKLPVYEGEISCCHCGKISRIAAWLRQTKKGETFMSLKLSPPREQQRPKTDDSETPF